LKNISYATSTATKLYLLFICLTRVKHEMKQLNDCQLAFQSTTFIILT